MPGWSNGRFQHRWEGRRKESSDMDGIFALLPDWGTVHLSADTSLTQVAPDLIRLSLPVGQHRNMASMVTHHCRKLAWENE